MEGDSHVTSVLKNAVREAIGPIATPDIIVYCDLPKVCVLSIHICAILYDTETFLI